MTSILDTVPEVSLKRFLHAGCGYAEQESTPFQAAQWDQVTLDSDPEVKPDVLGTLMDMAGVEDSAFDALFSNHSIEHLYPHQVEEALNEFSRVLNDDGYAVIVCPDLQAATAMIAQGKALEPVYESPAGPITPFDIVYGFRGFTVTENPDMLNKCGFTEDLLRGTLLDCGFATVATAVKRESYDIWAVASKSIRSDDEIRELALAHFPQI